MISFTPIANDKIGLQIRKLKDGSIDKAEFLNRLKYMKGLHISTTLVLSLQSDILQKYDG